MTKPTIGEVKWLAFVCAIFFALTSVGQYVFVQYEAKATVRKQLDDWAKELDEAVDL